LRYFHTWLGALSAQKANVVQALKKISYRDNCTVRKGKSQGLIKIVARVDRLVTDKQIIHRFS